MARTNIYARDSVLAPNGTIPSAARTPSSPPSASLLPQPPSSTATSPSPSPSPASAGADQGPAENYTPLFVVCALLGAALLIMAGMVACTIIRRHRRRRSEAAEDFLSARRRDPTLTWDEYERSRKMTHSTVMLEEERVRVAMIDKSLRSRASVDQPPLSERAPSIPDEPLPPAPASPRAHTNWISGRLRRQRANSDGTDDFDADDKETLLGGACPSPTSPSVLHPPHCAWGEAPGSVGSGTPSSPGGSRPSSSGTQKRSGSNSRASSGGGGGHNRTNSYGSPRPSPSSSQRWLWELPDGKKCPPAWANARWGGEGRDAPPPVPPPSLRTRTPPIWAHPAFRPEGGAGTIVARSFTNDTGIYPSEMAKVKPASLV